MVEKLHSLFFTFAADKIKNTKTHHRVFVKKNIYPTKYVRTYVHACIMLLYLAFHFMNHSLLDFLLGSIRLYAFHHFFTFSHTCLRRASTQRNGTPTASFVFLRHL